MRPGNFYGTTAYDGPHRGGSVYSISPSGIFTVVNGFIGKSHNGGESFGPVIQGTDGYLYGTTTGFGAYGDGTVFKLDVASPTRNLAAGARRR